MKPILFCGQMVRAILDGRKTQTRRVIKPQPFRPKSTVSVLAGVVTFTPDYLGVSPSYRVPKYPFGSKVWVQETWRVHSGLDDVKPSDIPAHGEDIVYVATDPHNLSGRNRPSIFMPQWASRITLEITDVRVQRIQEISEEDAKAEGMVLDDCKYDYEKLWDSLNKPRGFGWDTNPWVFVYTFKRVKP